MSDSQPPSLSKRAFALLCGIQLTTAIGNTGLISVLPAIGRSIGLPDYQVAAVFSLSALAWAICSPIWARASDRYGRKPLVLLGLGGFMISMFACAAVVSVGLRHLLPPLLTLALFLLARSLFGLFGSAANPATQAMIAEATRPEARTQAMSSLAGAFGLGTMIGPFLAPLFVLPVLGLAGPLFCFGLIAATMLVTAARGLPSTGVQTVELDAGAGKGPPLWRDRRVRPFLVLGFIVATCQTAQQQTLGFLIIDKLHLPPARAQGFIAVAMMFGAMAGLLAQWGIIRMFDMTPRQLMRWGVTAATLGNLVVAVSHDYWGAVSGFAIASLGFGFARPGFTAGASLAVALADQARVAGAIGAVNGINALLAPAFVRLYTEAHAGPFLLNAALLGALLVYAFVDPELRRAGPAERDASTLAGLEKSDEPATL